VRRPALGIRRLVQRADGRREQGARKARLRYVQDVARRGAALPRRRAAARTARSGSRTTRTSWSSGIRTCS
jgi:hypothetical protein